MSTRARVFPEALHQARKASTKGRQKIAAEIAADARSRAPVLTGAYRGGIGVKTQGDRVFVVDSDPESSYKEFGTIDTTAHATLTDAARKRGKYKGRQPKGRR